MDIFGGSVTESNNRGPRGFHGRDGTFTDIITWMPHTIIDNFQINEERCCFFIKTKDIERKGKAIQKWLSRSKKGDLTADIPSSELEELSDRYAIIFEKNRYSSEDLILFQNTALSYGFLCVTYRTQSEKNQVLVSNYQIHQSNYCEIMIKTNEIIIHIGQHTETIQYSGKGWTTLFIEYNSDDKLTHFRYNINGDVGSFIGIVQEDEMSGFALGARWDDTYFFHGQISSLEIYKAKSGNFPETLKDVIIKNQSSV